MVSESVHDEPVREHDDAARANTRTPRRGWGARVLTWGAILGIGLGIVTVTSTALFPEQMERVYGAVQHEVGRFRIDVLGEVPHVTLGASGGQVELDRCDGTFTEMLSYVHDDVPPVWAAVDVRITPKTWATIDDLLGLGGEFGLRSCFYADNHMKFVGLEPAPEQ